MSTDDPTEDDRSRIEKQLVDIERQISNLSRSIAQADDPEVSTHLLSELRVLTSRRRELEHSIQDLTVRHQAWASTQIDLQSIHEWRLAASANLDDLDYNEKRLLLELLGLQSEVWKGSHVPRFIIRMGLSSSIVSSTTCRTDHNVVLGFNWSDVDLAKKRE